MASQSPSTIILESFPRFLDDFFGRLASTGIEVNGLEMDHIGYQAQSDAEFDELKPIFLKEGALASEEIVNGRRVAIVKLNQPWVYKDRVIPAVECYAPKPDQQVCAGWEHAEFVVPEGFEPLMNCYPTLDWITTDMSSPSFAQVKLKLGEDMMVKFHLKPILEMVNV